MSDLPIEQPTPPPDLPFRRPADYYNAPLSEVRPIFPPWVPLGCGSLAALFLVFLFGLGALVASGRGGPLVATLFDVLHSEMDAQIAKDVSKDKRTAFDQAFDQVTKDVRAGRADYSRLRPFLQSVQIAASDDKLDSREVEELTKRLREATEPRKP